ncbi:MAG: NADH-quinone oxidoreductase subunit C [Chthoniobacterales bacterium]|nr:NADH-quinone oxidoreductase subunit C [Chthoniobacterales bacterium]MCX7713123.1 NADH-quinone oxidoreductase subunit C [Chthoniobacterales bacterium]
MTDQVFKSIIEKYPDKDIRFLENSSPSGQHSLLVPPEIAVDVAYFLRDCLGFDYCSNVTGVDWINGVKKGIWKSDSNEEIDGGKSGFLEVVYHLYSVQKKVGPLILRVRTKTREDRPELPSLTPVWKSAEFQEREVFDLFGIWFGGHPDMRRLLMWEEFEGHPMRKDYIPPDDYEYEPTPHGQILERIKTKAGKTE